MSDLSANRWPVKWLWAQSPMLSVPGRANPQLLRHRCTECRMVNVNHPILLQSCKFIFYMLMHEPWIRFVVDTITCTCASWQPNKDTRCVSHWFNFCPIGACCYTKHLGEWIDRTSEAVVPRQSCATLANSWGSLTLSASRSHPARIIITHNWTSSGQS